MRELRRCANCGNYMMVMDVSGLSDEDKEKQMYCVECRKENLNRAKSLSDIEYESKMQHPTAIEIQKLYEEQKRKQQEGQNN